MFFIYCKLQYHYFPFYIGSIEVQFIFIFTFYFVLLLYLVVFLKIPYDFLISIMVCKCTFIFPMNIPFIELLTVLAKAFTASVEWKS